MTGIAYEPARCVVCGHADSVCIAEQGDLRDELEWLWEYHQQRLRPDMPPEHLRDRVAFSEHLPLRLVRCRECGLVYRNPVERARELREIYAGDTPSADVLASLHDTQLPALREQARVLREELGGGGAGLEVGSYVGGFLTAARECGLQVEGVDINADVNRFARSLGHTVHDGELSSIGVDRTFDCVAIWNTFDQLADPRGAVNAARRLLRPGGILVVRVPNGEYYARARQDRARWPALAQNNLLTFPYRWGFTPTALSLLVGECGLRVRRIRGDVLVPIADEWTLPWAREEERAMKERMAVGARDDAAEAPWFELYAAA